MSNHSEILPAAPLRSGLPDARPASAMGGIDPGALPELVLRSAPAPLEPFANPARQVFVDGPETAGPNWVFFEPSPITYNHEHEYDKRNSKVPSLLEATAVWSRG